MENVTIIRSGEKTVIKRKSDGLVIVVEKNRVLTPTDNGYTLEATLYKEDSTFVVDCHYIFEVIEVPLDIEVNKQACTSMVDFFFHSVLDTNYYVIGIPKGSKFFPTPSQNEHTIYDIDIANLYDILSGH